MTGPLADATTVAHVPIRPDEALVWIALAGAKRSAASCIVLTIGNGRHTSGTPGNRDRGSTLQL
jgi:hypothetical protein